MVGEDVAVTHLAVVPDVATTLEEVAVSDGCASFGTARAMHLSVLSNVVVVAHPEVTRVTGDVFLVLTL